jgi:putative ABC transport system permease protein
MKTLDIIKNANSNLFRSKLRTLLTILAIFVGTLTLTLTAGIGAGVEDYINKQVDAVSLKDTLTILPGSFSLSPGGLLGVAEYDEQQQSAVTTTFLTQKDIDRVKNVKNVKDAQLIFVPKPEYITVEGEKKYKDDIIDVFIPNLQMPLAAGNLPVNKGEMLLAYKFLEPLKFAKAEDALGKKITYRFKSNEGKTLDIDLTVTGVQINNLSGSQNRINYRDAQGIYQFQFGTIDASQYAMASLQPNLSKEDTDVLKKELKDMGYAAQSFEDSINSIRTYLKILQVSVNMFAIIVIIAASIGIVNTLLMAVYERTREIGLLKALGMKSRAVFMTFALEAASLGFWGGVIGVLAAIGVGTLANKVAVDTFLKGFEGFTLFIFPYKTLGIVILGTMLVGLLAGTLPAIKAARLNPIDALRYE